MDSSTSLLAQQASTDPQAFAALYDRYYSRVYTYLRYRCGDAGEADDLVSQVFEKLLDRLGQYQPDRGAFEPWLFTIARNVLNDYFRKERRSWLFWQEQKRQPRLESSLEEYLIQEEENRLLSESLSKLEERSRDLLSLKFFAKLNNRQIAEITQISESNVGVILFRAIAQLRAHMKSLETAGNQLGVRIK